ncbi:PfkB family carbohydrate kinase [Cellulomonas sp. NPDC055163]
MTLPAQRTDAATILAIGEALMDVVVRHDGATTSHPGGSPANVALGLARLGSDVAFATELGDDAYGVALAAHLAGAGVQVRDYRRAGQSSVARAVLDPLGAATYTFDVRWTLEAFDVGELGSSATPSHRLARDERGARRGGRRPGGPHTAAHEHRELRPEHPHRCVRVARRRPGSGRAVRGTQRRRQGQL